MNELIASRNGLVLTGDREFRAYHYRAIGLWSIYWRGDDGRVHRTTRRSRQEVEEKYASLFANRD